MSDAPGRSVLASVASIVLSDAGVTALEPKDGGHFEVVAGTPPWLSMLLGVEAVGDSFELRGQLPFLDHFLVRAEDHWRHGEPGSTVHSGFWVETVRNRDLPLEASARRVDGRPVLILKDAGDAYTRSADTLQKARESLLDNEVLERLVRERTEMIRAREEEIAVRLVSAAEFRDTQTGAHIRRIGRLSVLVGEALGLDRAVLDHLELAAAMHDVGKIGIPDEILLKPASLDARELEIMRRHTLFGARILEGSDAAALQLAQEIALSHHEKWDGSGYPQGLAGEEIPLVARIVAVVDFFDATVYERPYKPAMPVDEVLELMRSKRGTHFDPRVLDVFLALQRQVAKIRAEVDVAAERDAAS